jgi:hypothetical protein
MTSPPSPIKLPAAFKRRPCGFIGCIGSLFIVATMLRSEEFHLQPFEGMQRYYTTKPSTHSAQLQAFHPDDGIKFVRIFLEGFATVKLPKKS